MRSTSPTIHNCCNKGSDKIKTIKINSVRNPILKFCTSTQVSVTLVGVRCGNPLSTNGRKEPGVTSYKLGVSISNRCLINMPDAKDSQNPAVKADGVFSFQRSNRMGVLLQHFQDLPEKQVMKL